jgi:hypothetical protein
VGACRSLLPHRRLCDTMQRAATAYASDNVRAECAMHTAHAAVSARTTARRRPPARCTVYVPAHPAYACRCCTVGRRQPGLTAYAPQYKSL